MRGKTIEVCVESLYSARVAQEQGADRVELCAALTEGGITPSMGMVKIVRDALQIAVNVIVRPRRGDFCYSDEEFECMKQDIIFLRTMGIDGLVFGILTPDGNIDVPRMRKLITLARPLSVTVHRAFDAVCDPMKALEDCISLGADRILTSGLATKAEEAIDMLTLLVKKAEGRISIMPGSGVNDCNIVPILSQTGAHEIHLSAKERIDGNMLFRKKEVPMSNSTPLSEYELERTSDKLLKRAIEKVRNS